MVPLNHTLIIDRGASPRSLLLVLHGIYGSGGNWRTFARRLTAARPDWGVVLVDLRMHGGSQAALPPHTLDAAVADLHQLRTFLGRAHPPVRGVCGHSFGGKVALGYRATADEMLLTTWLIDSTPSASPDALTDVDNTVATVLTMLESLPPSFTDRDEFIAAVHARGHAELLAQWLAMNLELRDGRYVSRLDLGAMRALLTDYYQSDLWPALEDEGAPGEVHVVVAGASTVWTAADRARLAGADTAGSHVLEGVGHWVHIEALGALVALVAEGLPRL